MVSYGKSANCEVGKPPPKIYVVKPKGNFDLCYVYDKVNTMMYIDPKGCMKASCDCIYEL